MVLGFLLLHQFRRIPLRVSRALRSWWQDWQRSAVANIRPE